MKHLAQIQVEFIKESRKWDNLTYEEQKAYLQRHPKSKRRITAQPGQPAQQIMPSDKKELKSELSQKRQTQKQSQEFPADAIKNSLNSLRFPKDPHDYSFHQQKDEAEIQTDNKNKPIGVEFGIRDLGTWHSRPFEEDDDYPNWDPASYEKYSKLFREWAERQPWFNSETMTTRVDAGEKAWAYFEIRKRNLKSIKKNLKLAKLTLKYLLKKKRGEDTSAEEQKLNNLEQKTSNRYARSYYENFLRQKKDNSWSVDRKKYNKLIDAIKNEQNIKL